MASTNEDDGRPVGAGFAVADDDDDNESVTHELAPDHELLRPLQEALHKQLTAHDERVSIELRQKEAQLAQVGKKRETLGTDLYKFQKGLAGLQVDLERKHDEFQEQVRLREQKEQDLKAATEAYQNKVLDKQTAEKQRIVAQQELDKIKITVKEIDAYNEKLTSEILVARRAAYGAEDSMQQKEKEKKKQDEVIDQMNEQKKTYEEQLRLLQHQLAAQQKETATARATLEQATKEMEVIAIEKREYLGKWKSSVINMASRDAALKTAEQAVEESRRRLLGMEMEASGYVHQTQAEQEKNERSTAVLARHEAEQTFLTQQLQQIEEQRRNLNQEYAFLKGALEETDKALKSVQHQNRQSKAQTEALHKEYERLVQERQKLDVTIVENVSKRTTVEKGAQNLAKNTQKMQSQIHEIEIKMGEIQNEIARIKVDSLNTAAHNKELQTTLDAYVKELKEKDKLSEKYEQEIRQRHDKIEKRQHVIALLNKKFDSMTANKEDENTGPLEATIKNVAKEIVTKDKETAELQKEWIKCQTELVALVGETTAQQEIVKQLMSKETILTQKRLRLRHQTSAVLDDIRVIHTQIRVMQHDMVKLNDLIAKNTALQIELSNANFTLETEFQSKMKDMHSASLKIDAACRELAQDKDRIFADIVEVEKQIMLWEKKIQLERETQEALDPEYGQPEILGMKKEIHRMRLRLTSLKKQQELMTQEMVRTVHKHDAIKLSKMVLKSQQHVTQANLQKKVVGLKATLRQGQKDVKRIDEDLSKLEEEHSMLSSEVAKQQAVFSELEDRKSEVLSRLSDADFRRRMNKRHVLLYQERTRAYEEMLSGKFKGPSAKDRNRLAQTLAHHNQTFAKLVEAIRRLKDENPRQARLFNRLLDWASPEI